MPWVVGVTFRPVTKVYYFDPAGHQDLQLDERVVVETSRGRTLGRVTLPAREVPETEISGQLKPVIRRATAGDTVQEDQALHREPEALKVCQARAAALGLPMKVVKVEFSFDMSSLLVYFSAEQRIDFRNLVHDLAQTLRTRVEMRQIGVRDEAKFLGGHGRCGLHLCCASWLRDFTPVSIKMAKQQDLPLNPAEISGVCGRLLCCLSYEDDFYASVRREMPRVNSTIVTPEGPGKVRQVHVLRRTVTVQVDGPNETISFIEVPIPEDESVGALRAQGACGNCPRAQSTAEAEDDAMARAEDEWDDLPEAEVPPKPPPAEDDDVEGRPVGEQRRAPRKRRRGR